MSGTRLKIPPNEFDHIRNSLHAPVVMVEYGDFECPHCAAAMPVLEGLLTEYGSDLCFMFRHFPLANIHSYAEMAAVAAEAAGLQSQFWEMHHLLFENSANLSPETILRLAKSLDLDIDRFEEDRRRDELLERVRADFAGGLRSGVNSTPTIYLNGERFNGPAVYRNLKSAIVRVLGRSLGERSL